jgi:hypothetical protein
VRGFSFSLLIFKPIHNTINLIEKYLKFPLTPSLSPAFAEAASRRQAGGEREGVRGLKREGRI